MKIDEMLGKIRAYQAELGYDGTYDDFEDRMSHVRSLALAMFMEVAEFVDWTPWKPWREIYEQEYDREEAAYELIDIFFFMANLWQALDLPVERFEKLFEQKLEENRNRIKRGYNKTSQLELEYGDTGETINTINGEKL